MQAKPVILQSASLDVATGDHGLQEPLAEPCNRAEGNMAVSIAHEQATCGEQLPSSLQLPNVVRMRTAFKDDDETSSEPRATSLNPASSMDADGVVPGEKQTVAEYLSCPKDKAMDEDVDADYVASSADEDESQTAEEDTGSDASVEDTAEPYTPLEFQIPEDVLRATMNAPGNTKASYWSSNLYRGPEDRKILVHYCKSKQVAERVAQHFINEKVVGFDIEWKVYARPDSIKKNVSLLQLACEDRIALFHIALFSGTTAAQLMPPTLKTILESPGVYKVGVAVKGDFSRVSKFLNVKPQGVFELSRLHNLVQFYATDPSKVTKRLVNLADQVQQHLQLPLYKGGALVDDLDDTYNVRSSDWSLPLNHQQIHYAAADAYAGFRLYDVLEEKRKQLRPTPPRPEVCDDDPKTKPKPSGSKPRKKRAPITETDGATSGTAEEPSVPTELEEEREEEVEDTSKSSQDTDGYQTAQEELSENDELDDEEAASSEDSYESTDESEGEVSIELAPVPVHESNPTTAETSEIRVDCISPSWIRGPDPGYPSLPGPPDHNSDTLSEEDSVDISEGHMEEELYLDDSLVASPDKQQEKSGFDDPELEEALQDLSIDNDGNLQRAKAHVDSDMPTVLLKPSELPSRTSRDGSATDESPAPIYQDHKPNEPAPIHSEPDVVSNKEEQQLLDLLHDSEIIEYLHSPTKPSFSEPPADSHPTPAPQPPEFDLATSWAQSYLASSIPSPTSRVPSHIRATIPHLRAYHMWHYQKLALGEIARLLRDPPLSESTVGSYVLQAITLEKMEYNEEEVRNVLAELPETLRRGKWRGLAEKVGVR